MAREDAFSVFREKRSFFWPYLAKRNIANM